MKGTPVRRWKCSQCSAEGWSKDGSAPLDHDRPDGRVCRKASLEKTGCRMKPVAWRWVNQFGKEVITSNREFAALMEAKDGLHVEPLFLGMVGDKRRSGSVDSAPLAQSLEPPISIGDVQREFYAWWGANQVDRLHGMIAQNCALAAWHDAYDRYVRKASSSVTSKDSQ